MTEEVLSVPRPIQLRTSELVKLLRTVGQDGVRDQAQYLGIDMSSWSRVVRGQRGVSVELIAAVLRTFPHYGFGDLFVVAAAENAA